MASLQNLGGSADRSQDLRSTSTRSLSAVRIGAERGRLLFVADVLELLNHTKSAWWVRNCFAPVHRFKVGRSPAWWERDALDWLDSRAAR